jgi:WD40 repeat protein
MAQMPRESSTSSEVETLGLLDLEVEIPAPPRNACSGSHGNACSPMLATMASDGNKGLSTIPKAAASLTGPTHTSEPIPKDPLGPALECASDRPSLPTQFRDPHRYQFLGEHGRGGLGRVSRAHDRELGRDVAIKELLSRGNVNEVRFLREVLITARLEHPGIVPVHEAGRWPDGTPFYAMKLVSGRPLRDLISERMTVEQRIGLLHHVIAVADAIAYAHGRNIIHRDLKPANVIVGDFGETVVIDWGLAKDLTSTEAPTPEGGPFRTNRNDDLTSAGSVLGTPAYMAPEQARGEQVDKRADVFAIGAMLWELCTTYKIPPTRPHLRHRMLRRAGIDEDLATIACKALDPAPEQRYPDAGALAADLKAFKSGARITARSYSLFAMLSHWTRRHRTLAVSAAAAVVVAVTGSLFFVHNIAVERDRADASKKLAEESIDELTLKQARLLLTTDPSAAIDALTQYHGADLGRADQIRAEAVGRGVALLRALPHTDNILWTEGTSDGAIISLSTDGTISRTSRDGTFVVLSRGVSKSGALSYSPSRHLLAYACDPSDLCLFDVLHAARIPVAPMLQGANAIGISFSPNGALIAVLSQEAVVRIFDITDPAQPSLQFVKTLHDAINVKFFADSVVAARTKTGIEFVRTDGQSEVLPLPGIACWTSGASEHKLALATTTGQAFIIESSPLHVTAQADLCHGPVAGLRFIPKRRDVAYACRAGAVGIWDLQRGTVSPRVQLEGHADLIAASPTGDYIVAAGGNGTVMVLDLYTDLIASYKGHGFRLTSITPPTPEHPFLISADVRGAVRAWPAPTRLARVVATSSSPFHTAIFDNQSTAVIATTWLPALTTFSPSASAHTIEPHEAHNVFLENSSSGKLFATYGLEDLVEIWSSTPMTRMRIINTGHGSISELRFVDGTNDLVTSGHDGRLVRWTSVGEPIQLAHLDQPIDRFELTSATGPFVLSTTDGALWHTANNGQTFSLRRGGSRVNRLLASPNQQIVYAGYANGDVIAIHTNSWEQQVILQGYGAVRELAITDDDHTIAVATNDGTIHVRTRHGDASRPDDVTWVTLEVRARHITLAPDGLLMAASTDGTIWLYSTSQRRWLCLPTGTVDLGRTVMTGSGNAAVILDLEGRLIWIDLDAARELLL